MDTLKHVLHDHTLYRRQLSEHCDLLECLACMSGIHGPTSMYCCERCKFYLHASCATEIPSKIQQHPLHLDHTLTLRPDCSHSYPQRNLHCHACRRSLTKCGFYCSQCPFNLHVSCAMVNLPPDEESGPEQAMLEHFAHECPLVSLNVKHEYNIRCEACNLQVSGEVYGCRSCVFFLHKTCAESPQEIRRHPFHSHHPLTLVFRKKYLHCHACRCRLCAAYHCKDCGFNLCHDCTVATLPLGCLREETEDSQPPTDHFFHQHPLAFHCTEKEMQVRCKACDQQVSGEFYGCPDCSFFVHKPCVQSLSREVQHYLHPIPNHPLILSLTPPVDSKPCKGCRNSLGRDFAYNCEACDFYLHVPCALQTLVYLEQGASKTIENLMIGKYELPLFHAQGSSQRNCDSCGKHCEGPAYRYDGYYGFIHKSCAEALSNLKPFHHKHRLTLVYQRESYCCNVCGEIFAKRICYRCEECDNFKLHLSCARKPNLKHPLHEHDLTYFQRKHNSNSRCRACGKTCAVDLYCCELCNVHIHYDCLQIPHTIKSNHHIDALTLHESIVEDDSGEYYCDICERRRDPELWAYYCEVCKLIAHVSCAVSPVKLNVGLENPELEELDEKIEGLQQEKDNMKAYLKELTTKLEALKTELEELKRRRAAVASEWK